MNDLVPMPGPIIYQDQPCVTLPMIDAAHGRPKGTARRNFNAWRSEWREGEHYFEVPEANEIRLLGLARKNGSIPAKIILVTALGYLELVPHLQDALAERVTEEKARSIDRRRAEAQKQHQEAERRWQEEVRRQADAFCRMYEEMQEWSEEMRKGTERLRKRNEEWRKQREEEQRRQEAERVRKQPDESWDQWADRMGY